MKKISVVLSSLLLFSTISNAKSLSLTIDPSASELIWEGKKIAGQHHGHLKLKSGKITVVNNAITGGNFEIDMKSLTNEDISDAVYKEKLIGHLKSDDFFSVEKHPTAIFTITKVEKLHNANDATHTVTGNLKIKGIAKSLSFPAKIKIDGKSFEASGKATIDRTKYDIKYRSKNFFKDLGDKVIDDHFVVNLKLLSKK